MINELRPERPVDLPKIIPYDGRAENGNWISRLPIRCFCHGIVYNFEKLVYSKYMNSLPPPPPPSLYLVHQGKKVCK